VEEWVAQPEWDFGAAFVPFDGEALRSFAVEHPLCPGARFFGAVARGFPQPEFEERRLRFWLLKKKVGWSFAASMVVQGVSSSDLVVQRLPSCKGTVSDPRLEVEQQQRRAAGPFCPPPSSGSCELICILFVFLDLSVWIEVSM
jgi:hypothetical protein